MDTLHAEVLDTPWVLPAMKPLDSDIAEVLSANLREMYADEYQREAIETAQSEAAAQAMTEHYNK